MCIDYLLDNDIPRQENGECDADHQEDIVPHPLGCRAHQLLIIDTEEKAHRKDREEAAIENLGNQYDHDTVN